MHAERTRSCQPAPMRHGTRRVSGPAARRSSSSPPGDGPTTAALTKVIASALSSDDLLAGYEHFSAGCMDESCEQERGAAAWEPGVYLLQLPISFEHGFGTTRAVSRDRVRFTTRARVGEGQCLKGYIRFPAGDTDTVGSVLRYVARVSSVQQPPRADDPATFEVTAQFEQLAFVLGSPA